MAKNVFKYLNLDNAFWVDIIHCKYGNINFWQDSIPPKWFWVFWGLCNTASVLKPNLWLRSINTNYTSFLCGPWLFDIPLSFKPTFLNVQVDFEFLTIFELAPNGSWDNHKLKILFGDNLNYLITNLSSIDNEDFNNWVCGTLTLLTPKFLQLSIIILIRILFRLSNGWIGKNFGKSMLPLELNTSSGLSLMEESQPLITLIASIWVPELYMYYTILSWK